MVTNHGNTEALFRGAIMSAGSPLPTGDIKELQPVYDQIVDATGCSGASDTLACLRQVPADNLTAAAATAPNLFSYSGLATPWAPRADGKFLTAPPQHLVLAGQVANVPFITGDALDEGTMFATGSWNVTYVAPPSHYILLSAANPHPRTGRSRSSATTYTSTSSRARRRPSSSRSSRSIPPIRQRAHRS